MKGVTITILAAVVAASSAQKIRQVLVDASTTIGTLKNLQGTNSADTAYSPPGGQDTIHNKDPALGALFPQYGIEHVLIYTFPDVFHGFGKTGAAGDPSANANYNWTAADDYVHYVTSNGAKASIQFAPTNGTNADVSSPEILAQVGSMITDRYMNGAYNSGFHDALALFEFYPEADVVRSNAEICDQNFEFFAHFSRAVSKTSPKVGVSAWGGNQAYPVDTNYSVYDPYVSRFYKDCRERNVPIKAASFHFTNQQFSFDPYDIVRVVDKFRVEVLVPAGLPDLPIWATEYEPAPYSALPTSASAIKSFNNPSFFASFSLGVSMYAQDTSIAQAMPWPGFGYNGTGAGGQPFHGYFNRSASGPVPLNAAKALPLQADLVRETPHRIKVQRGSSEDGFAVLAGRSPNNATVQILLNNYQFDFDIAYEVTAQMVPLFNTSTTAYPVLQDNGLLNGEAVCFQFGACLTFPQPRWRNNTSTAYRLEVLNLPWDQSSKYRITVRRVADGVTGDVYLAREGRGNSIDIQLPFPGNAQDLVVIETVR
ncbi:hypothetical protein BDV11DRAFT_173227 [Aspergillus similis]